MAETINRQVSFAALDPWLERNIVKPTEAPRNGRSGIIAWGDGDAYPDYLLSLYAECTTLKSVIDGCVDYTSGDDVTSNKGLATYNRKGLTARELVRKMASDWFTFGGFALEVVLNKAGDGVAEIYPLPLQFVRTDKEGARYWYSEDWSNSWKRGRAIEFPKWIPGTEAPESVYFCKGSARGVYPVPAYGAAVRACEMERAVDSFHLSALNNGFTGSYLINFNNGVPDDQQKGEIERAFDEKFSGHQNAGRIMFSWNPGKDSATTIEKVDVEDFGDKYSSLAKWCRQQIFTAFRANPNLFGIPTESLGFSSEEYASAFKLFNRTMVLPVQRAINDALDAVLGVQGAVTIKPFSLDGAGEQAVR